jgi:outer membrane protein OmpA-like peptidoglycan-associated protein
VYAVLLVILTLGSTDPASAQEDVANPDVLIDYGVLEDLTESSDATDGEVLPAPAAKPISRMLISSDGVPLPEPDLSSPDVTVSSVPTTPIESSDLSTESADTPDDPAGEVDTAAGDAEEIAPDADPAATEQATEAISLARLIEGQVRVTFEPGSAVIPDPAVAEIDGLVRKMTDDPFMRIQVLAYAAGDEETASVARRVSLGRALAVRKYLGEQGVAMDRMDVRALGNTALEEPLDRVDIIPLPQ